MVCDCNEQCSHLGPRVYIDLCHVATVVHISTVRWRSCNQQRTNFMTLLASFCNIFGLNNYFLYFNIYQRLMRKSDTLSQLSVLNLSLEKLVFFCSEWTNLQGYIGTPELIIESYNTSSRMKPIRILEFNTLLRAGLILCLRASSGCLISGRLDDMTHLLRILFQWPTTYHLVRNLLFLLILNPNLPWCCFIPVPHILLVVSREKLLCFCLAFLPKDWRTAPVRPSLTLSRKTPHELRVVFVSWYGLPVCGKPVNKSTARMNPLLLCTTRTKGKLGHGI